MYISRTVQARKYLWYVENNWYVTVGNNGELLVVNGIPNHNYGPNIFKLEPGSQGGQYRISTYGMIPEDDKQKALYMTVVEETNGQWELKFSNDTSFKYDWCFTCKDGVFAIQWCGMPVIEGTCLILYRYKGQLHNNQLLVAQYAQNSPSPEHFLHNFHPLQITDIHTVISTQHHRYVINYGFFNLCMYVIITFLIHIKLIQIYYNYNEAISMHE